MTRPPDAAFTTLGVPVFFALVYAVTLTAGLPVALLLSPLLFRLALMVIPAPSRLSLPTCPHLIRCDAERAAGAARRAAQRAARRAVQAAEVHEVRPTAPATPAPFALVVAVPVPVSSADARRVEGPRRAAA